MSVNIRPMTEDDVKHVYRSGIEVEEFQTSEAAGNISPFWPEEHLYDWVETESDVLLVAEDNKKIVGYFLSYIHLSTKTAYIRNVYVDDDYRRKGIGTQLVKEGLSQFSNKDVEYVAALVKPDNVPMKKLFKDIDFNEGNIFTWIDKFI